MSSERLARELSGTSYRGWKFYVDDPEPFFFFSHPRGGVTVYCTPDWEEDNVIAIQVQSEDGRVVEGIVNIPFFVRTKQRFMEAVRPWLDKYQP